MPIYEYACKACEHRFESIQKMSDEPLEECPQCHKKMLKKLVSAAAFRLKGSGWYETDFKSGDKKNLSKSDSSTSSTDDKAKSGSKDSQSSDKSSTTQTKTSDKTATKAKKSNSD